MKGLFHKISKFALGTQLKRNMISGSMIHGLNILIVMVSYPIYIGYLGFELFSVWSLLSIVISFAMMDELGISRAVITYTANAKADNDYAEINRIYSASVFIILIPSILIALGLWFFSPQVVKLLDVPPEHFDVSVKVVQFIGITIGTFLFYDLLIGIVTGMGRLDISNLMLLFINISKVIFTIAFLIAGMSLMGMIYANLFTNILFIVLAILLIRFKFKIKIYRLIRPLKRNIKELLEFGASVIGMQVFNMFSVPLVKVVLSRSVGIESVGVFELVYKAAYSLRAFFEKGLFAIMPEIASLHGSRNSDSVNRIYNKVKNITSKLIKYALPFLLLFVLLAPVWLKIWLQDNYSKTLLYGFWLLQPGIFFGLIAIPSYYALMGTRNQKYCFFEAVIRTVLLILYSIVFIAAAMGELYLYLGFSLTVVISNLYILILFRKKYHY